MTREKGALKLDDRIDCVAMGVAYWVESMAQDADKQAETHREDILKRELDKFLEGCFGVAPEDKRDMWVRT